MIECRFKAPGANGWSEWSATYAAIAPVQVQRMLGGTTLFGQPIERVTAVGDRGAKVQWRERPGPDGT